MIDTEPLRRSMNGQARACDELGSPFTARLMRLTAARLMPGTPLTDRLFGWQGDLSGFGAAVCLRLAGALHALVLSGRDAGLAAVYPPNRAPSDDALWSAIDRAMRTHAGFIDRFVDNAPQTNEIARSAALIVAANWVNARFGLPFVVSEMGASGGLNLHWPFYGLTLDGTVYGPPDPVLMLTPENRGLVPPTAPPRVVERRGVDLNPIDLTDPAEVLRLRSYIWADQTARHDRIARALTLPPVVPDRGDAAAWLEARLAEPRPGHLHFLYNTIAWQYFPDATKAACTATLEAAGARATEDAPLVHFQMENDRQPPGAALTVRIWPGGETRAVGRFDFHGRWLDWQAEALT